MEKNMEKVLQGEPQEVPRPPLAVEIEAIDKNWLDARMQELGETNLKALCREAGLNYNAVQLWVTGNRAVPQAHKTVLYWYFKVKYYQNIERLVGELRNVIK